MTDSMEKFIGLYRKGSLHDSYGFITSYNHENLFIHDREFGHDRDQLETFGKQEVYVSYFIRDSKVKKGFQEGFSGSLLISEKDGDLLIQELKYQLDDIADNTYYDSESLCEIIFRQLKKIDHPIEDLEFIKDFFDEVTVSNFVYYVQGHILFGIMKYGLQLFFPDIFEQLNKKLDDLVEKKLLKEMGHEGANVYDVLTNTFFNNYNLFEQNFKKFKNSINKEFIFKVILESDVLPWDTSFDSIKRFVILIKSNNSIIDNENAFRLFFNLSTPKIRLYLWLNDLSDNFVFDEYKENVWSLEKKDQALFIKKMFFSMSKGLIEFGLRDLNEIKVLDIKSFREIKRSNPDKDYNNLDFNVSLLIYLLNIFSSGENYTSEVRSKIFEYFREYISESKYIGYIDFFYTKCIGRTKCKRKKKTNPVTNEDIINPETGLPEYDYSFKHEPQDIPIFHQYCDGQKNFKPLEVSYPKETKNSYCAGSLCFGCAIDSDQIPDDFQKLTIKDFLSILKIPFDHSTLVLLSGFINKANLLIDRLQCASCKSILIPATTSTYTYHMINTFYCNTKTCPEHAKNVYLNHCFNRNCSNVIDSRVTKKCTHQGYGEFCGWYVCDFCYSCCSTEKFRHIKEKKEEQGLKYNCSPIGHDELKVIFCYHCGSEMGLYKKYYKRQLEIIRYLTSEDRRLLVSKKEEKDGIWKFTLNLSSLDNNQKNRFLDELIKYGFKVTEGRSKYFADLLLNIALKCKNENCANGEIISPLKREKVNDQNNDADLPKGFRAVNSQPDKFNYKLNQKWRPFSESHKYLTEKINQMFKEGNIEILLD